MFEYVKSFIIYDRLLYDYVVGRPGQSIEFESYIRNLSAIVKIYRRYSKECIILAAEGHHSFSSDLLSGESIV